MITRAAALLLGAMALNGLSDVQAPGGFSDTPPNGAEPVAGPVAAWVFDVIDGDTIAVRARIWLGQDVDTRVRLFGIDTPELKARCEEEQRLAHAARDFVREKTQSRRVSLMDVRYDKYGRRVLARVVTADGEDLGQALIRRGLARPYDGGARRSWCTEKTP